MISNVTALLKSTISALLADNAKVTNPNASAAHRIGPQRVIFNARLGATDGSIKLGNISLCVPFRGFSENRPHEESVLVHIGQQLDAKNTDKPAPLIEKRTTLKVKPDTRFLAVIFMDGADCVLKSERIVIK